MNNLKEVRNSRFADVYKKLEAEQMDILQERSEQNGESERLADLFGRIQNERQKLSKEKRKTFFEKVSFRAEIAVVCALVIFFVYISSGVKPRIYEKGVIIEPDGYVNIYAYAKDTYVGISAEIEYRTSTGELESIIKTDYAYEKADISHKVNATERILSVKGVHDIQFSRDEETYYFYED